MGTKPNIKWMPCGVNMEHAVYVDLLLFIVRRTDGTAELTIEEEPGYSDACNHRNLPRKPASVTIETHVRDRHQSTAEAKQAALNFVVVHRHGIAAKSNQERAAERHERGQYRIIIAAGDHVLDADMIGFWIGAAWNQYAYDARHITLVHGSETHVDRACDEFARKMGWDVQQHSLEFAKHMGNAYKMRDLSMLRRGGDVCVWFPGRYGTSHVANHARKIGIPVLVVKP